jgi:heterogeneous nuclear ribonucleoprotein F/H
MSGSGDHDEESYVVKLRGLPWSTMANKILKFFSDCNIKNGKLGIHMTMSREGWPSGKAYVEMETDEDIEKKVPSQPTHWTVTYRKNYTRYCINTI